MAKPDYSVLPQEYKDMHKRFVYLVNEKLPSLSNVVTPALSAAIYRLELSWKWFRLAVTQRIRENGMPSEGDQAVLEFFRQQRDALDSELNRLAKTGPISADLEKLTGRREVAPVTASLITGLVGIGIGSLFGWKESTR